MDFYMLKSTSNAEEYIILSGGFANLKRYCMRSEYQFLDSKPVRFEISERGGLELPDVILQEGIWFIADRVKDTLDDFGVDYIFYKKAEIVSDKFGIYETYWITVPPRIDCLDLDESDLDNEWDFIDGLIPNMNFKKISISPGMLGRYDVFKIIGINDYNVYITSRMYDVLASKSFSGLSLFKL